MPVNVIGTLKPKNNGKFPVAEAVDIKVTDDLRLDKALENKADLSTVNFALAGKANVTDLATSTANLQGQINQIVISSSAESIVAPEVAAARVGVDETSYQTLKGRLDAEYNALTAEQTNLKEDLSEVNNNVNELQDTIVSAIGIDKTIIPLWTNGKYIKEDGTVTPGGDTLYISDFIEVFEDMDVIVIGQNSVTSLNAPCIHFYDVDKTHIGYSYNKDYYNCKSEITTLSAKYIRLSHHTGGEHPVSAVSVNLNKDSLFASRDELKTLSGVHIDQHLTWGNSRYIKEDGTITTGGSTLSATEEIEVLDTTDKMAKGLHAYQLLNMPSIHYYDQGHNHVGYVYANGDYDMSQDIEDYNAKYIRLSHYITNDSPIDDVKVLWSSKGEIDNIKTDVIANKADIEKIKENTEIANSEQFINILNGYSNSEVGKYISNGVIITNSNWCTLVDFVPVEPNETYAIKFSEQFEHWLQCKIAYYSEDKSFISEEAFTNNLGVRTPENCKYIRLSTVSVSYQADGHDDFSTAFMEKVENGSTVVVTKNEKYNKSVYPLTTLSKKKWVMFGDSITENNFRSNANYHDYVRTETGIITINKGLGGSGYKNRDDTNNAFYQIALNSIDEWKDADVITVMGGVNDHWTQISVRGLGSPTDMFVEPEDITSWTTNTVMACFNKMLDVLISNSDSRIGIISPLPCYTTQSGNAYHEVPYDEDCNMSKFVEACKKSCELHGIPYLDLFHNSGLRPWDSDFNAKYFKTISADSPDGLHPNELGHKYFYPMVREFIKSLI